MSQNVNIEHEMRKSYLEYSLSVIIGRAIPDVRDGLKPVHRRILFAQQELANSYNRPPKKCARIVGDVIGKYHPHGDSAVYDALVRLAQDFSMRDPLEDGQGNFGSIDGDAAAAMRYTEVRMSRLASEFLNDIDKETVDFRPNYDNTLAEPVVLPTKVPNLLLNGSSGIAVGMATNIPPHNLSELSDALLMLIDAPESSVEDLMDVVQGPDFPTGGYVYAGQGLYDAYTTGRGTVKVRGKVEIEDRKKGFQSLIIREIPFGLNKSSLVEKIAALINDRKIDGVSDLRDESDRRGIRVVIELKRGTMPEIVINSLYKYTPLETSFGINMLAVVDNRPVLLNLKTALAYFLDHRREVVVRRTKFELRKAEARAHILEGLLKALDHIDEVVSLIRSSATPPEAKERLMQRFELSEVQAQAILDMRLKALQGLEREKLQNEYDELEKRIAYFRELLADPEKVKAVLRDELIAIRDKYGDERKTEIQDIEDDIDIEDLIEEEQCVFTLSHGGNIKRVPVDEYTAQKRGGKGVRAATLRDEDYVDTVFTAEAGRTARGVNIVNFIQVEKDEHVNAMLHVREMDDDSFLVFATRSGTVKRMPLSALRNIRTSGIRALTLDEGDELINVMRTDGSRNILLATHNGQAICFAETDVRPMGREAVGVRGIRLKDGDWVVGAEIAQPDADVLSITENGYGKRTPAADYIRGGEEPQHRGGSGMKNYNITDKTGPVAAVKVVQDSDDVLVVSDDGVIIRMEAAGISELGRATQGVRIMRLSEGARVISVALTDRAESEDAPAGETEA